MESAESPRSVEIARAETPRGEVVLRRRTNGTGADVLELRVNGVFVMDTLETTSEIELAAQARDLVEEPSAALGDRYTAIYRTENEYKSLVAAAGLDVLSSGDLLASHFQRHSETRHQYFICSRR